MPTIAENAEEISRRINELNLEHRDLAHRARAEDRVDVGRALEQLRRRGRRVRVQRPRAQRRRGDGVSRVVGGIAPSATSTVAGKLIRPPWPSTYATGSSSARMNSSIVG